MFFKKLYKVIPKNKDNGEEVKFLFLETLIQISNFL